MVPKGWVSLTLGDITRECAFGPRFSSDLYDENGTVGTIRTTDLDLEGNINYKTIPYANLPDSFQSHYLKSGDLLITRSGTCGIPCIFEEQDKPVVAGAFLIRFVLNDDVHAKFLHMLLKSNLLQKQIEQLASGGVQKNLSGTNLKKLSLVLPPFPEQRKIAQILSTWDKTITTTERLLTNRQQQKKALMQRLLTGKQRFAGFKGEWRKGCLSQFVGKIYGGGTPSRDTPEFWNGTIPWVTVKDLVSNTIKGAQETITELGLSESASNIVPAGTVIIATRMALGKAVIASCDVAINQDLKAISGSEFIDSVYLHYWLLTHSEKISCLGTGSTVKGIQLADIKSLPMRIPADIQEQKTIASVLSTADAEITTIQNQLDNLNQQKKALMQQLLTGKRRVKV